MSLRFKTLLLLGITLALLLVVLGISARRLILLSFAEVEQAEVQRAVQFAVAQVNTERHQLDISLVDWSAWDDTYAFIHDHSNAYIQSNLQPSTLADLDWSFVVFLDEAGPLELNNKGYADALRTILDSEIARLYIAIRSECLADFLERHFKSNRVQIINTSSIL